MTLKDYELHELAGLFPAMRDEEFDALKASIKQDGFDLAEPITLWQGKVIDGRHRLKACRELGVEPAVYALADDADPEAYVLRKNGGARRHLRAGQRAMIAARLSAGSKRGGDRKSANHSAKMPNDLTQGQAAEVMGVSVRLVAQAAAVLKVFEGAADDVIGAVERGDMSLNEAYQLRETPADKVGAVLADEDSRRQLAAPPGAVVVDKERLFQQWDEMESPPNPDIVGLGLVVEYVRWLEGGIMGRFGMGPIWRDDPYWLVSLMESRVGAELPDGLLDRWFYDLCWGMGDCPYAVFEGKPERLAGFVRYLARSEYKVTYSGYNPKSCYAGWVGIQRVLLDAGELTLLDEISLWPQTGEPRPCHHGVDEDGYSGYGGPDICPPDCRECRRYKTPRDSFTERQVKGLRRAGKFKEADALARKFKERQEWAREGVRAHYAEQRAAAGLGW